VVIGVFLILELCSGVVLLSACFVAPVVACFVIISLSHCKNSVILILLMQRAQLPLSVKKTYLDDDMSLSRLNSLSNRIIVHLGWRKRVTT
jgi:uncharacterized membrane protein